MTVAEIAQSLLIYTDKHALSEAEAAGEGHLLDVVSHINGGAQELYDLAPGILSRRPFGGVFPAPASITITGATEYSSTAQGITGFAAWMVGCTFRVPGQPNNRLIAYDPAGAGTSTWQLPFLTSGSISAVAYGDAIALPEDLQTVLPRPQLAGCRYLRPAQSEADLMAETYGPDDRDYGHESRILTPRIVNPGEPTAYWIETFLAPGSAVSKNFFRVQPLPEKAYILQAVLKVRPPAVVEADLFASTDGVGATQVIPVPNKWDALYLLPIIRQRFTASGFFANGEAKREIARQYDAAVKAVSVASPQGDRTVRIVPGL